MGSDTIRTVQIVVTGTSLQLQKALADAGLAGDEATAEMDASADAASGKMDSVFSKFTNMISGIIPGFNNVFNDAHEKLSSSTSDVESSGSALGGMALPIAAVGAAVVGVGVIATKLGLQFDETTAKIAANAGISQGAAQKIGQAFLATAGTTTFSGQTIAAAYAGVAAQLGTLNGKALNATQAMDVMRPSMDLAEASGESLSSAVSAVSGVLQAFQMNVSQAGAVSDILYNTAKDTGTSIDSLASSLDKARSKMGAFAPSVSDLSGLILDLTQHGETGRAAISSLGSMFTSIVAPTAAVTKAQEELGVSFINAKTGALDPLSEIFAQLQPKLEGMGSAQQVATLKAVGFGSASQKLATTIMAGSGALDLDTLAMSKHGSAADAAAKTTDTFSGAWAKAPGRR